MITWFFTLLGHRKPSSQPSTHVMWIVIKTDMTQEQFTQTVADCFVDVERPEKHFGDGVKIFNTSNTSLIRLTWGEKPCAVGFVGQYGKRTYGMALVQLPEATYEFLMQAYNSIGKKDFDTYIGKHEIDMTPIKSWFPACS